MLISFSKALDSDMLNHIKRHLFNEISVAKAFFDRLGDFYAKFGEALTKNSESASIFPNASDRGSNREVNYLSLLNAILPFGCRPVLGGFLFASSGAESGQIDIAVINSSTPRFNMPNAGSADKTFAPVDGTIGVVSAKSYLSKAELIQAIGNIASIPPCDVSRAKLSPYMQFSGYSDFPAKFIYAHDGIDGLDAVQIINRFYKDNPQIPYERRPELIHVLGKYLLVRGDGTAGWADGKTREVTHVFARGIYQVILHNVDQIGFAMITTRLVSNAAVAAHIFFDYSYLVEQLSFIHPARE